MKSGRIRYGNKKTPDGFFLIVVPVRIFELLNSESPSLLKSAIVEKAGLDVFIKVKSRKSAEEIARKAELISSRLGFFNENS